MSKDKNPIIILMLVLTIIITGLMIFKLYANFYLADFLISISDVSNLMSLLDKNQLLSSSLIFRLGLSFTDGWVTVNKIYRALTAIDITLIGLFILNLRLNHIGPRKTLFNFSSLAIVIVYAIKYIGTGIFLLTTKGFITARDINILGIALMAITALITLAIIIYLGVIIYILVSDKEMKVV